MQTIYSDYKLSTSVGVGFDTKGAGTLVVKGVRSDTREVFVIPDSREGWVLSVAKLIDSYFGKGPHYVRSSMEVCMIHCRTLITVPFVEQEYQ